MRAPPFRERFMQNSASRKRRLVVVNEVRLIQPIKATGSGRSEIPFRRIDIKFQELLKIA